MISAIWFFVKPYLWRVALIGGAVLTVLGVMARLRNAGKIQERLEQQAKISRIRDKQAKAQAEAPRTTEQTINALEKGEF